MGKREFVGTTVGGLKLAREEDAEGRRVTIALSELAIGALTGDPAVEAGARMESALRFYLADSEGGSAAWPYPGFLRGTETPADTELELDLPTGLWDAFEEEAVRQGVTVEQLSEHAVFYFAAELDAGRVTQRILDQLDEGDDAAAG
jgi:hypothetical protein